MKISLNWVRDFIKLGATSDEITDKLTKSGLEVEGIEAFESIQGGLKGIVIGEVLTCEKHPDADKLSKTTVDIGGEVVPVVCGAPNVAAGQKVVVATVGATIYPSEGDSFVIKKAKIRGEVSIGMICAEDELGLGQSHDGILVLDTDLPNGTPAATYFEIENDEVIEIGLTPNRADATSHFGVAREIQALFGEKASLPDLSKFKSDKTTGEISLKVEDADACLRYAGLLLEGVQVKSSPDWLKARLKAIGLSPINNIVDITNYVLHGLGQPMHAFDADKITTGNVVIKTLPSGTLFKTLDEVERKLCATDLMICNGDEPMCIAGVFGGLHSGVTENTQRIFLESAYFNPDSVRKTSLKHGLKTDASFRFERGTDVNMVIPAIQYAALLIKELAGGKITTDIIDNYPQPLEDFKLSVSYKNIDRLIGVSIGNDIIKSILTSLDIKITEEKDGVLQLIVPSYRVDVQREADVIEDILRIYGYDNIPLSEHLGASYLAEAPENDVDHKKKIIGQSLAASGFNEIITNSLTKPVYSETTKGIDASLSVEILNKLSDDLGVMRQSLLHTGLEVLAFNINRKEDLLRLFEFGKEYRKVEGKYKETEKLAIYLTGNKHKESWAVKSDKAAFDGLYGAVLSVFEKLGLTTIKTQPYTGGIIGEGISFIVNNNEIGFAGLVSKKQLKQVGIKQAVLYAELDLKALFGKKPVILQFEELSKFPKVRRDLSLVLDKKVKYQDIKELAQKIERKLLSEINVFDVYAGEHIEEGKKSYSVSFMLQDVNQTLTDKVIDKTMERLMNAFESELGAIIRK